MPYKDLQKQKDAQHRSYLSNKQRIAERHKLNQSDHNQYKKEKRSEIKAWLKELKEQIPCADCKESYPCYVMEFDHVRGEKWATITHLVQQGYAKIAIEKEIQKCDLVCANCHRLRHKGNTRRHET